MYRLQWGLASAGLVPFAFLSLWLCLELGEIPLLGSPEKALSAYALVIATFLAGSQWGLHLQLDGKLAAILALSSNLVAICLWISYTLFSEQRMLFASVLFFSCLLLVDIFLYRARRLEYEYIQIRCTITTSVLVCLLAAALFGY